MQCKSIFNLTWMENYVNNSVFELQPVLVERDLYAGSNSSQQLICTFFVDF